MDKMTADHNQEACNNDKEHCSEPDDKFVWSMSAERKLLVEDLGSDTFTAMTPMKARGTRQVFLDLPLTRKEWSNPFWAEKRRIEKEKQRDELHKLVALKTKKKKTND